MRRISPIPPCPSVLDPDGSPGYEERQRAIAHFGAGLPAKDFSFSAYSHDEVRLALLKGFDWVCAYCERQTGTIDVEHFRPKGAVQTEEGRKPGYYWLAATWENLLPSCPECNTQRRNWTPDGEERKSGKGNWFPLADESARATAVGEEAKEEPLLLHPYVDDPSEHLEFVEDGFVRPRKIDGVPSRRGEVTKDLLGLNRHGLPEARRARLVTLEVALKKAHKAQRKMLAAPGDEARARKHERRVAELEEHLRPGAGFSAMVADRLGLTR